jgi:hypothetical protein
MVNKRRMLLPLFEKKLPSIPWKMPFGKPPE